MKNIQVGDIVRVKNNEHRYVVEDMMDIGEALLCSVIDGHRTDDLIADLELVEGIERVQRGDIVQDPNDKDGIMKVLEVGFNTFFVSCKHPEHSDKTLDWYTFQEAKDWKIVGKEEELNECICSEYDGKGLSVCGFPCPIHKKDEEESKGHTITPFEGSLRWQNFINITHVDIDGEKHSINYILKALKAYEE